MMLISAMIASNLPMTTVFAAAKKQQVKQETKKLEEQSRKMQQEIKDLDEKMIKSMSREAYFCTETVKEDTTGIKRGKGIQRRSVKDYE